MQVFCPCGSLMVYENCCGKYITGGAEPLTPESLMRSRYTAYTIHNADYIYNTTHPAQQKHHDKRAILEWAKNGHWVKLEIVKASGKIVEFKAFYLDAGLVPHIHHERSAFEQVKGKWYYKDGVYPNS